MGPLLLSRPVRARLSACQVQRRSHEHLSAFSCKRRGFCPSCDAYRVVESAAHLLDPCGGLRFLGQPGGSVKVYSGCCSGCQNPPESILLLLLLRLWGCGRGADGSATSLPDMQCCIQPGILKPTNRREHLVSPTAVRSGPDSPSSYRNRLVSISGVCMASSVPICGHPAVTAFGRRSHRP